MLLQTALYLTSVLSAIALIALILIQDQGAQAKPALSRDQPSGGLGRAVVWSTAIFLLSALGSAVADGGMSGSLLNELPIDSVGQTLIDGVLDDTVADAR